MMKTWNYEWISDSVIMFKLGEVFKNMRLNEWRAIWFIQLFITYLMVMHAEAFGLSQLKW